ncbi:L,D-transpeptidase [uncultured Corynebacterium sp.]|uniref:L,D-transpeptidase n=1 Tax=uncultured Corynebacterium sp. TaxID=159447 RepID=UPI00261AFAF0|nr:L,D-transpeptidase [uncultured Corynebacterium sp.]
MSYKPRHAKPSATKRRAAAFAAAAGVFASLAVNPTTAEAAPAPQQAVGGSSIAQLSSNSGLDVFLKSANTQLENLGSSTDQAVRDAAWNLRNSLRAQADGLAAINPDLPAQAKASIDQTVERLFPGLIAEHTPKPKPKPKPKPQPAPAPAQAPAQQQRPAFDYGPCPKDAKACVDVDGRRSWLQNNGQVYYTADLVGPGRPGQETPRGTFYVNRKVKDEISYEFNNAPMPYATYFTYNGIAFHQGDPTILSAGCVRMYQADAQRYFNDLQIGDKVFVY